MKLDVHGMTKDEAVSAVEAFVEKAYLNRLQLIKIITGKGKKILLHAVLDYLNAHPAIEKCRLGHVNEGGWGVVVAYISY